MPHRISRGQPAAAARSTRTWRADFQWFRLAAGSGTRRALGPAALGVRAGMEQTPFLEVRTPDEAGDRTFRVTRVGDGWSLALVALHGTFPIAGVDPSLRPLLERIESGAELPFICRML